MRAFLDTLYRVALWLAALCLVVIAVMVGLQLLGRIADGTLKLFGFSAYGFVILSLNEIGANLFAASGFLALAGTLRAGAHIRVTMLLTSLSERARRWVEVWALGFALVLSAFMTWHIGFFAYFSFVIHEVSPGVIPVPLAIPQMVMTAGVLVLTIALADELATVVRGGRPSFRSAEDSLSLGKEG
jgi:TRAP-type C4-dicarboxylate transport system permease small subunit